MVIGLMGRGPFVTILLTEDMMFFSKCDCCCRTLSASRFMCLPVEEEDAADPMLLSQQQATVSISTQHHGQLDR